MWKYCKYVVDITIFKKKKKKNCKVQNLRGVEPGWGIIHESKSLGWSWISENIKNIFCFFCFFFGFPQYCFLTVTVAFFTKTLFSISHPWWVWVMYHIGKNIDQMLVLLPLPPNQIPMSQPQPHPLLKLLAKIWESLWRQN